MDLLRKVKPPNIYLISKRPGWKEKSIIMLLQFRVEFHRPHIHFILLCLVRLAYNLLTSCKCLWYSLSLLKVSKFGPYLSHPTSRRLLTLLRKTDCSWCWKVNVKWEREMQVKTCNAVGRIMAPHRYPGASPWTVNMLLYRDKKEKYD